MSLDFNDIVKQGEVKLKSRKVGVWQKRWIIFRRKSSSGPRRLEKYPDVSFAEIGQQAKMISLEKLRNIARCSNDGKKCIIEIQPDEGPNRIMLFSDEAEAASWEEALRQECLSNPGVPARNSGADLPNNIIDEEMFHVNLIPSMALALSGECLLQVTSDDLILSDIINPSKELMLWPLSCLRRYGGDHQQFMFESGRHCKTGEGLFIFSTVQGGKIYQKVDSATKAICEAYRMFQRREKDTSPRESAVPTLENVRKQRLGQSISCPDAPPVPPPRPRPSPSQPAGGDHPPTRASSLPTGASSSLTPNGAAARADFVNNNSGYRAGADGNDLEDVEKYLDADFRQFLSLRKEDNEPAPSQQFLASSEN